MTVKELIQQHPNDTFDMMTLCGYVYLTPENIRDVLNGNHTYAHPGDPEYANQLESDEILNQIVSGSNRTGNGVWHLLTCSAPDYSLSDALKRDGQQCSAPSNNLCLSTEPTMNETATEGREQDISLEICI